MSMTGSLRSRSGGEIVLDVLKVAGVEVVFGVISVHNIPFYDAVAREGGIRVVAARGEQGAVNMADGYARATGRLGVAITSTGVGAANAAGPLLEALVASSSLLHVTGQVAAAYVDEDKAALHAAKDQLGMLKSVCKEAIRAARTEEIHDALVRAIQAARSGRPGPVSVEIPIDQQYRALEVPVPALLELASPVPPEPVALARASERLAASRRPLIWAGGGTIQANATGSLRRLAERLGAGVLTTAAGRGSLPEDHPLCLGNFSHDAAVVRLLGQSDLLLAIGTRFRGNETRGWELELPSPLMQIDIDPDLVGRNYPADVRIVGDAGLALDSLLAELPPGRLRDEAWVAEIGDVRQSVRASLRATLGPYERLMDDLRALLPRDAIVVRDVTVPATAWGSRLLEVYEPRTAIHSAALAIGEGLPMAIGAGVGRPDRRVVLLAGDGGFAVSLGELGTAVQEGARLVIVLFNDRGYGILRNLQDAHFGGRRLAVDLHAPDFMRLGDAFGTWYGQVCSPAELAPQLREALQQDRPALLEIDMAAVGPMAQPFTGAARLVPPEAARP